MNPSHGHSSPPKGGTFCGPPLPLLLLQKDFGAPPPHLCTACGLLVPIVWWDGTLLGASSTQVSASPLSLVPMQAHFLCAAQRASFPSYYTCCSLLSWTCVLMSASMTCCQRWDKVTHPGVCCPALGCSRETGMNPWSRASSAELLLLVYKHDVTCAYDAGIFCMVTVVGTPRTGQAFGQGSFSPSALNVVQPNVARALAKVSCAVG